MGKPLPNPLARQMMSGLQAEMLEAEPLARAAKAGLDLVHDQQRAPLLAKALHTLQEFSRPDVDAALALHHLQHDAGNRVVQRNCQFLQVVVGRWITSSSGRNGSRYFFSQVTETAPTVRP
jgi:hypothetical protein